MASGRKTGGHGLRPARARRRARGAARPLREPRAPEGIGSLDSELAPKALQAARAEAVNERNRLQAVMDALPVGIAITDAKGAVVRANRMFDQTWGSHPPTRSVRDYAQYKAWWVDTGLRVPACEWAAARAVQCGETVVGQVLQIQRFDGGRAFVLNSAAPVRDAAGRIVGSAVAIQDVTSLRRAEQLKQALNVVDQVIHSTLDVGKVMQRSVAAGARAIGCQTAILYLRTAGRWVIRYAYGLPPDTIGRAVSSRQMPLARRIVRTQQVFAVDDAFHDHRVNRARARRRGVRSMLAIPLVIRGQVVGVLCFNFHKTRMLFEEPHLEYGRRLAASISLALENARLVQGLRRELAERRRIERALQHARDRLEHRVVERTAELRASQCALMESEAQFRQMAESVQEVFWLADAGLHRMIYVSPAYESIWGRSCRELYDNPRAWADAIHPEDRDRIRASFLSNRRSGLPMQGEYRIVRPDGSIRWISDRGWSVRDPAGRVYRVAGVASDVTERRQMEAEILNTSESERERIGRDLHDSLGQSLTAVGYLANALREELARKSLAEAADMRKLTSLIETAAEQAHELARGLLPTDLRRRGIVAALQELASHTQEVFGVPCRYRGLSSFSLGDADAGSQLYRIAQEAVTNAARYSGGGAIEIGLIRRRGRIALSVRDTGVGISEAQRRKTGMGMRIMRYRADMIGASLRIESTRGRGTTVICSLSAQMHGPARSAARSRERAPGKRQGGES